MTQLKKIYAFLFILALTAWFCCSSINGLAWVHRTISEDTSTTHQATSTVKWDGAEDYPIVRRVGLKDQQKGIIEKIEDKFETLVTNGHIYYYQEVLLSKIFDKYLYRYNMTTSLNGTVNDPTDPQDVVVTHTSGALSYLIDSTDCQYQVKSIIDFRNSLETQEIQFVLFLNPFKNGTISDNYNGVYIDRREETVNSVIDKLQISGVQIVDYQGLLQKEGCSERDVYFITDHHWLPRSALSACAVLADYLNLHGFSVDTSYFNAENYSVDASKCPFLGSQGRKVTQIYADFEEFPILHPLYDSDLTAYISKTDKTLTGTIENTLYDYSSFEDTNPYTQSQYTMYSYGDIPLIQIHNNLKRDGKRLLLIKESFANSMIPFLSNAAEYVDAIDLRSFKGSLRSYINANKPDMVVVVYGVSSFVNSWEHVRYSAADPFNFE